MGIDDPLSNVGIMSLNNKNLPYKKPILKRVPGIYVNTRSVIQELNKDYGGIHDLRSSSQVLINHQQKQHMYMMAGGGGYISNRSSLQSTIHN